MVYIRPQHISSTERAQLMRFSWSQQPRIGILSTFGARKKVVGLQFLLNALISGKANDFAGLCGNRPLLEALDRAGLRLFAVGPEETVGLAEKGEKLIDGMEIPILLGGRKHSVFGSPIKCYDFASQQVIDLGREEAASAAAVPLRPGEFDLCGLVIGGSPQLPVVLATVKQAAPTAAKILISGETGTGKELIAKIIHANSSRRGGRFIACNLAAIPAGLVESALFGHEKGSFTGAVGQNEGLFAAANNGTIFIDEIGELPPEVQVKVLRVLQDGVYQRVGGNRDLATNARVIAATNKDLAAEVKAGRFREDLFYRIAVIQVNLPSLRERKGDLLLLARHFLAFYLQRDGRPTIDFSEEAERALLAHDWPGNVRELQNCVEGAVALTPSGAPIGVEKLRIRIRSLPSPAPAPVAPAPPILDDLIARLAQEALERRESLPSLTRRVTEAMASQAMERTEGDERRAAKLLDISPKTLCSILSVMAARGVKV